jgi:FMN phosphatase YigB (HAD superfamily)
VFSWEVGSLKPSHENFLVTLRKLGGLTPHEIAFIDDSQQNVESARDFGMVGIQFSSVEQLKKELVALKLISQNIPRKRP